MPTNARKGRFDPRVFGDLVRLGYDRSFALTPRDAQPATSSPGPRPCGPWRPRFRGGRRPMVEVGPHPVDLGGIGKGLALRWASERLADQVHEHLIAAGGDIVCRGAGPAGDGWRVSVEDLRDGDTPLAVLALTDQACATSSVRVRRWRCGGRPVHHLVDPRSGRPGGAGLLAVTVVAPDPADAEVTSKTLFLHGARDIAARSRTLRRRSVLGDHRRSYRGDETLHRAGGLEGGVTRGGATASGVPAPGIPVRRRRELLGRLGATLVVLGVSVATGYLVARRGRGRTARPDASLDLQSSSWHRRLRRAQCSGGGRDLVSPPVARPSAHARTPGLVAGPCLPRRGNSRPAVWPRRRQSRSTNFAGVGWVGVVVPWHAQYRPTAVALGSLALYGIVLVAATASLAGSLARRVWLPIHSMSAVLFALCLGHGLLAGSDSHALWSLYALSGVVVGCLQVTRMAARHSELARAW